MLCSKHDITVDDVPVTRICPICLGLELRGAGWEPRHLLKDHSPAPPPVKRIQIKRKNTLGKIKRTKPAEKKQDALW